MSGAAMVEAFLGGFLNGLFVGLLVLFGLVALIGFMVWAFRTHGAKA